MTVLWMEYTSQLTLMALSRHWWKLLALSQRIWSSTHTLYNYCQSVLKFWKDICKVLLGMLNKYVICAIFLYWIFIIFNLGFCNKCGYLYYTENLKKETVLIYCGGESIHTVMVLMEKYARPINHRLSTNISPSSRHKEKLSKYNDLLYMKRI